MDIDAYLYLCSIFDIPIDQSWKSQCRKTLIDSLDWDISEPHILYRKIKVLKTIGSIDEATREMLCFLLEININKDHTFPVIANYIEDSAQTNMCISILKTLDPVHPVDKTGIQNYLKSKNMLQEDYYELYSSLFLADGTGISRDNAAVVEKLSKDRILAVSEDNLLMWSWHTLILGEIDLKPGAEYLPNNSGAILNSILRYASYFQHPLLDLIFLDTILQYEDIDINRKELIKIVDKTIIDLNSDLLAYLVFYKFTVRRQLGAGYSYKEIAPYLKMLRRQGGFAMSSQQEFQDIRSTYLLTILIDNAGKQGRVENEKR